MPCNCGHLTCLCGVPCLCDASKCKCQDCDAAVGRVCNICNKSFYYEYLTLKETSEKEVCGCFMVTSKIRGANPTIETNGKLFYTVQNAKQGNMHIQQSENQIIQQSEHYHAPLIPESLNGQNNNPSSTNNFKNSVLLNPEQNCAFVPKSLHITNSNSSTEHSECTVQEQSEQNRALYVTQSFDGMNNDSPSLEHSGINILRQSGLSQAAHSTGSVTIHTNDRSNLEPTAQLQEQQGEDYASTVSCELREQPESNSENMESNYIELDTESFYTIPQNTYPELLPVVPMSSPDFDLSKFDHELRDITLKWLYTLPNIELKNGYNDLLITNSID